MSRCFAAIVSAVTRRRGCVSFSIIPEFHFGIHDGQMWSCIEDKPRIKRIERIIGGGIPMKFRWSIAIAAFLVCVSVTYLPALSGYVPFPRDLLLRLSGAAFQASPASGLFYPLNWIYVLLPRLGPRLKAVDSKARKTIAADDAMLSLVAWMF
jgi:hypothetical protein